MLQLNAWCCLMLANGIYFIISSKIINFEDFSIQCNFMHYMYRNNNFYYLIFIEQIALFLSISFPLSLIHVVMLFFCIHHKYAFKTNLLVCSFLFGLIYTLLSTHKLFYFKKSITIFFWNNRKYVAVGTVWNRRLNGWNSW